MGNTPVLVLICTIDMTFVICTADRFMKVLLCMTLKSFLIITICLTKCPDTTYICLLITITRETYTPDTQHAHEINAYPTNRIKKHIQITGHLCMHTRRTMFYRINTTHYTRKFLFHGTPMSSDICNRQENIRNMHIKLMGHMS